MQNPTPIKNIIFDLGGVLITFNPRQFLYELYKDHILGDRVFTLIFESQEWVQLDRGELSIGQAERIFLERAPELEPAVKQFSANWMSMFHSIPDTVSLLQTLHEKGYALYALSNFIRESFQVVRPQFPFFKYFSGMVLSFELGFVKPEKEIYEHLLTAYNLDPAQSIFIDDLPKNIAGASALGMHTIQFQSSLQLRNELEKFSIL